MRSSESVNLPLANNDYRRDDEQITRTALAQYLQTLRTDVLETRLTTDKTASLALRRHQFLLMGAGNG